MGLQKIQESLNLINEMKKIGFQKIIGTPHTYNGLYDNTNETIKNSFNNLNAKLNNDITVSYASEYLLDISVIEKAKKREITYNKRQLRVN